MVANRAAARQRRGMEENNPWRRRLLDGAAQWGAVNVRAERFGITRYWLVVYPPGITAAERRRIRAWRGWPLWGAVLWVVSLVALAHLLGGWTPVLLSTAAYAAAGSVTYVRAGDLRAKVRAADVMIMPGSRDQQALTASATIRVLAATMIHADQQLRTGAITPTIHEAIWWRVYRSLAPEASDSPGLNWSGSLR